MLDLKGLEAAARKLRNAEKEKFGSWPDADDSKSIAAATVTAYLQAVGPEPAVAVKPLEWEKPPHNESLSRAETDFGVYRAWTHFEAGGRWFWSLDGYQKASGEVSNEDEAKATCQADHDARISGRIRSALIASPPAAMTCDEQFALATKLRDTIATLRKQVSEHKRLKNQLVLKAYPAMDAIEEIAPGFKSAVHFVRNVAMDMERDYPEICQAEKVFARTLAALREADHA